MKNLFIILCLLFLSLPAFADYKPIPISDSYKYKTEVERYIDNNYKYTLKNIDQIYSKSIISYKKVLKNKNNYIAFTDAFYDQAIFYPIFNMFSDIIKITNKYVNLSNDIPATDSTGILYNFLEPYFKDNGINTQKIDALSKYAHNKQIQIEKYYKNAHNFIYSDNQ